MELTQEPDHIPLPFAAGCQLCIGQRPYGGHRPEVVGSGPVSDSEQCLSPVRQQWQFTLYKRPQQAVHVAEVILEGATIALLGGESDLPHADRGNAVGRKDPKSGVEDFATCGFGATRHSGYRSGPSK